MSDVPLTSDEANFPQVFNFAAGPWACTYVEKDFSVIYVSDMQLDINAARKLRDWLNQVIG